MLNRLDINREVAKHLDEKQWRRLVTNSTQAAEEKRWRDAMGRKSKLRTYRTVKDKLRFEPYLNFDSRHARILLTRLRSGTNSLRIERGRYENEAVEERICHWCSKVEDERHFLVDCDLYKDVRENALEMWDKEITQDKITIFRSLMGGLKVNKAKERGITHQIISSTKMRDAFLNRL